MKLLEFNVKLNCIVFNSDAFCLKALLKKIINYWGKNCFIFYAFINGKVIVYLFFLYIYILYREMWNHLYGGFNSRDFYVWTQLQESYKLLVAFQAEQPQRRLEKENHSLCRRWWLWKSWRTDKSFVKKNDIKDNMKIKNVYYSHLCLFINLKVMLNLSTVLPKWGFQGIENTFDNNFYTFLQSFS